MHAYNKGSRTTAFRFLTTITYTYACCLKTSNQMLYLACHLHAVQLLFFLFNRALVEQIMPRGITRRFLNVFIEMGKRKADTSYLPTHCVPFLALKHTRGCSHVGHVGGRVTQSFSSLLLTVARELRVEINTG